MMAVFLLSAVGAAAGQNVKSGSVIEMSLDIARVPSWFPVGFCLLTAGSHQYVAYYDAEHRMTVASRTLDSKDWEYDVLPSKIGWDSHNYVTMAIDDDGYIHLSGNMHCDRLLYFRTIRPRDAGSFEKVDGMTGRNESRCTYPQFMRGADNELIFHYRAGRSGSGNEIYNVYDLASKTWRRLLDTPLTDGKGRVNAYFHGPLLGPDGYFHLCWMWRDHGGCETNHDISYARSKNLVHWETVDGTAITLPITLETRGVVVDPVPIEAGLINMGHCVGFDALNRPIVTYHKYDAAGNSQIYNARWENDEWKIYQTSDWSYRWEFSGGGAIPCEIRGGPVRPRSDGSLSQSYNRTKFGSGVWKLDPETLKPIGQALSAPTMPSELKKLESDFPGMRLVVQGDSGRSGEPGVRYVIRWETLPPNRDRPRKKPLPEPSMLRLYKLVGEQIALSPVEE
jgi:hypothetical protein